MPNVEAPKSRLARPRPKPEATEAPQFPGKLMIMSPGERAWNDDGAAATAANDEKAAPSGNRRFAAMAAVVVLATLAGAVGGALATAGLGYYAAGSSAAAAIPATNSPLEATVARIDADLLALKAGLEHTSRMGMSQFNKTSDRLDKLEKAQAEPAARIAKLSEAVDKLRAAQPAATPVAAAPRAAGRGQGRHRNDHAAGGDDGRCSRPRRSCRPSPTSAVCRRLRAGCCATSSMAAR